MTSYRYLGYGVTNSNGVAHLDHDPQGNPINGYTGTGAGEVDVLASTDNPITGSSIVSEPSSVLDCIYYDPVTSDTSANYYLNTTNNSITYDGEYLVITSQVTGTEQNVDLRGLTDTLKGKTVNIEFEIDTNGITGLVLRTLNLPETYGTNVVDGVNTLENVVVPSDASGVIIRLIKSSGTSGQSFKFKNVKIYPV